MASSLVRKLDIPSPKATVVTEHNLLPFTDPKEGPCILDIDSITIDQAHSVDPSTLHLDSLILTAVFREHGIGGIQRLLDTWNYKNVELMVTSIARFGQGSMDHKRLWIYRRDRHVAVSFGQIRVGHVDIRFPMEINTDRTWQKEEITIDVLGRIEDEALRNEMFGLTARALFIELVTDNQTRKWFLELEQKALGATGIKRETQDGQADRTNADMTLDAEPLFGKSEGRMWVDWRLSRPKGSFPRPASTRGIAPGLRKWGWH